MRHRPSGAEYPQVPSAPPQAEYSRVPTLPNYSCGSGHRQVWLAPGAPGSGRSMRALEFEWVEFRHFRRTWSAPPQQITLRVAVAAQPLGATCDAWRGCATPYNARRRLPVRATCRFAPRR